MSTTPPPNSFVPPSKPSADQAAQACPLCNCRHALAKCSRFLKSSVDERSKVSKGLCYGCFKTGHVSSGCRHRASREECGRRHHKLLHGVKMRSSSSNPQSDVKLQDTQQASSENPPVTESTSSNLINVAHSSATEPASAITNCRIIQVIVPQR